MFRDELLDRIGSELNPVYTMWAADTFLEDFIKDKRIRTAIEIGRCNGISTLMLAKYSDFVFSFDVATHNNELIWSLYPDLRKKIYAFTGAQSYIDFTISELKYWGPKWGLNFNFAFIDGEHSYNAAKHDATLVSFCNRLLFHDVHGHEVGRFLKEIGGHPVSEDGVYGYKELTIVREGKV